MKYIFHIFLYENFIFAVWLTKFNSKHVISVMEITLHGHMLLFHAQLWEKG